MIEKIRVCRVHKRKGIPVRTVFENGEEFCPECKLAGTCLGIRILLLSKD